MNTEENLSNKTGENPSANNAVENKVTHLAETLDKLSSKIQSVEESLKRRQSETTTLKILFYTAFLVLLSGWIYSTTTLQRAQIQSMDSSMALLQKRMKMELSMSQRILYDEIQRVRAATLLTAGDGLPSILSRMNDTVALIEPVSEEQSALIQKVKQDSDELTKAYLKYRNGLVSDIPKP